LQKKKKTVVCYPLLQATAKNITEQEESENSEIIEGILIQ
jgi:hypothetical protein